MRLVVNKKLFLLEEAVIGVLTGPEVGALYTAGVFVSHAPQM